MDQIRLPYQLMPGITATLTVSLKASPSQKAIANALGVGTEELNNLISQRINEAVLDITSALGIPYDPEPD